MSAHLTQGPEAEPAAAPEAPTPTDLRSAYVGHYAACLRDNLRSISALATAMADALDRCAADDLAALAPIFDAAVRDAGRAALCLGEVSNAQGVA